MLLLLLLVYIIIIIIIIIIIKGKGALEQDKKACRGSRDIALIFSLTSALDGGEWLTPRPNNNNNNNNIKQSTGIK